MKHAIAVILTLLSVAACAQTVHTFSFGPIAVTNTSGMAAFTLIDGNQPDCAIGYCGSVQVRWDGASNPWWGMFAPNGPYLNPDGAPCAVGSTEICEWGFPNGGQNPENTVSPEPGNIVWDNPGCGPQVAGCTGHRDTTVTFEGYGLGIVITVHDTFLVHHHFSCGRGGCHGWYTTDETGGSGTAVYNPPLTANSAFAIECCYYGGRCICLPIPNPYCQINHYHCYSEVRSMPMDLKEILK